MSQFSSPALLAAIEAVRTADPQVIALIPRRRYVDPASWEKEFESTWCGLPVLVKFTLWGNPVDHHEIESVSVLDAKGNPLHELDMQFLDEKYEHAWLAEIEEGLV